jgi:hypothetical protein
MNFQILLYLKQVLILEDFLPPKARSCCPEQIKLITEDNRSKTQTLSLRLFTKIIKTRSICKSNLNAKLVSLGADTKGLYQ